MRSRRACLALAAAVLVAVTGCGAGNDHKLAAPFRKGDLKEAGGWAVLELGPHGTVLRFVPHTSFGIGLTLRNRSKKQITVLGVQAIDPPGGLVQQRGTRLVAWNPPPCTGSHSCPALGFLRAPYDSRHAKPLSVAPGRQVAVQLNFAVAGCARVPAATPGAARQIAVSYTTASGGTQSQVLSLGGSRLRLRMPSARDCAPRPKSTIAVEGPYAAGSDWTIPTSSGDSCTIARSGGLTFSSRLYEAPKDPAVRIVIRLPRYAGVGLYRSVGRPAASRGSALVAADVGVGIHGRQTFRSRTAVVTVRRVTPSSIRGRFHATIVGYRHETFRAFGAWACRVLAAAVAAPPRVVPWLNEHPVKAPAHVPLAAPCKARDLRAHLSLQGATGSLVGGVRLVNAGARTCSLVGWPTVSFAGAAASRERWRVKRLAASPSPPDAIADPLGSLRALRPGKAAATAIFWSNWCGPGSTPAGSPGAPPAKMSLGLVGGTTIEIPLAHAPRCDQPSVPSTVSVGPFTPAPRYLPASSRLPLKAVVVGRRAISVKPGLRALPVRRGEQFRYEVAVTNTGSKPFRFASTSCPTYLEQLDDAPAQAYVLNCRPAGAIAAHGAVLFAMQIDIPAKARAGNNSLTWELAPRTYEPPFSSAALWVAP